MSPRPPAAAQWTLASYLKVAVAVLLLACVIAGAHSLISDPTRLQAMLDAARGKPMEFIPLLALGCLLLPLFLIPSGPLQIVAGAIWGIPIGLAVAGCSSFAGNLTAFMVGRAWLQKPLTSMISSSVPAFPAVQKAIAAEGWTLVFLLRISPVVPDPVMNYLLSLTGVSAKLFALTTAVAMIPWTLFYVYIGSASKDIVATLNGGGSSGGGGWSDFIMPFFVLISGVAIVLYLGRVIKAAIARQENEGGERQEEEAIEPLLRSIQ